MQGLIELSSSPAGKEGLPPPWLQSCTEHRGSSQPCPSSPHAFPSPISPGFGAMQHPGCHRVVLGTRPSKSSRCKLQLPNPLCFPGYSSPKHTPGRGSGRGPGAVPPPHGATTLGTGTRRGAWGSAWPKLWAEPLSACPPGRRELHPLSTVPPRRQGLQCKELEPDQMQPEHTNTYGEVPRAFPRKRLLWKRRWRGPADLAGRRQWDCGGPCTSTSSPRLPGSASRACRQGTSFANPATALSFAPFLLPGCACLLPADRAWGGFPAGSQQQRVHPQHSPSLAGTTALGPAAPGLAWEQGYGENTTGPSSPHQSRAIARTSSGALTPQISKFLATGARPWVCTAGPPRPLW